MPNPRANTNLYPCGRNVFHQIKKKQLGKDIAGYFFFFDKLKAVSILSPEAVITEGGKSASLIRIKTRCSKELSLY